VLKVDHKKELKHLYRPSIKEVAEVDVPPMSFLMVDGEGDPNTAPAYREAVEALYAVAYALKFMVKRGPLPVDYAVMPLEGLWWVEDMRQFSMADKDQWLWTSMIMQPDLVTEASFAEALAQVQKKKALPALGRVRFERFHEGLSAQIMHVGPYAAEAPTIQRLHHYIAERGYERRGKHHEIYLGDPRRTAPERLRTVIRQPMGK
jgi:hypothetical protein